MTTTTTTETNPRREPILIAGENLDFALRAVAEVGASWRRDEGLVCEQAATALLEGVIASAENLATRARGLKRLYEDAIRGASQ